MQYHDRERLEQQLAELRTRRRNVRPDDAHRLLLAAGFERRYGKGDHWVYFHPTRRIPLTVDPRSPLLAVYVSRIISAIDEVLRQE